MRVKSTAIAAAVCLALSFALSVYAAGTGDTAKTLTCKDGTTSKGGKGACSHHGGVEKGGASSSAHEESSDKASDQSATKCKDGTVSHSKGHSGACSQHGGFGE